MYTVRINIIIKTLAGIKYSNIEDRNKQTRKLEMGHK
jgi:hypothetical protein